MDHIKQRTITAMGSGMVTITINGNTEKATLYQSLIPANKYKETEEKHHQGKQLTFYSLDEAKWKVINFEQANEVRVHTFFDQKTDIVILKK